MTLRDLWKVVLLPNVCVYAYNGGEKVCLWKGRIDGILFGSPEELQPYWESEVFCVNDVGMFIAVYLDAGVDAGGFVDADI